MVLWFAIYLFGSDIRAQATPWPQPRMAWFGDRVVMMQQDRYIVLAKGRPPVSLPIPDGVIDRCFVGDSFWIAQRDKAGSRIILSESESGREWVPRAIWHYPEQGDRVEQFFFYPAGEGHFVLVARRESGFKIHRKHHLVVVARTRQDKSLEVVEPFEIGVKGPLMKELPDGTAAYNFDYSWAISAAFVSPFRVVQDRAYLAFPNVGLFVEILHKGRPGRILRLYPDLDEARTRDPHGYDWAVMCVQPTREGNLLLAAREEAAVLEGRKHVPRQYTKESMLSKAGRETLDSLDQLALRSNPNVEWWTRNAREGKFERTAPPHRVKSRLESIQEVRNYVFHFDPDGNLVFPANPGWQDVPVPKESAFTSK